MTASALVIIQARMGSTRFPGKSMAEIHGRPILSYMMEQLSYCQLADEIVLAIPDGADDDVLANYGKSQNWSIFRGSEDNVLDRYCSAALEFGADEGTGIVRLTGDDILPDPSIVDAVIQLYLSFRGQFDYICTDKARRLPYGAGVEILSFDALQMANKEAVKSHDREHVVPFIKWNPERFPSLELSSSIDISGLVSLSIDTEADLDRNAKLIARLQHQGKPPYRLHEILSAAASIET